MIIFTALTEQGIATNFGYELGSLEANLDYLSRLVAQGHTLISVQLLDQTGRIDLPPAALDGVPLGSVIQALQQEWQAILSQPHAGPESTQQTLIQLTRQHIEQLQVITAAHGRMLGYYSQWLQQTQASSLSDARKTRLINRYQAMVDSYKQRLRLTQLRSDLAAKRLVELLS